MELIFLVGGLIAGAVVAVLFIRQKHAGTVATLENELKNSQGRITELTAEREDYQRELNDISAQKNHAEMKLVEANLKAESIARELASATEKQKEVQGELTDKTKEFNAVNNELAVARAGVVSMTEKLETQKQEIEKLNEKFSLEFENIANRILEEKTEKFTNANKQNIESLLKPLGENLNQFKAKVEEVYDKESKERFSLGQKVKELADLNQVISKEAKNLTRALKGESKTQGRWGEMILESILEKSGLVKDREYFIEHQLTGEDGKAILSDSEGKKMRPDAVVKYPDNRSVIIDSKVSLTAFTRYLDAVDPEEQKTQLAAHLASVKAHIVSLSSKGYDDYDQALDFVMLFIPSEPAYIAAMQGDPELWNFAYDKRILLLNPTNLITSLKLIVDLWKREYQNQNAIAIAERGAKLYDKFVGFVDNLKVVGEHLSKAQNKYDDAFKQLSTGNDNLVLQASKLKKLGLKPKKELPKDLEKTASEDETDD